jgi:hypothetical protein
MPAANIGGWIRIGVWALPVYALLTFWATFTHEPNRHTEVEAYARYISTTTYLVQHLLGSILGVILAVFGAIALGAYLASSRSGRLALLAMVLSVAGHCLVLTIFGFSTIISPVIGQLYLAGQPGTMKVNEAIFSSPAFIFLVVPGLLLYVVGTILFGVAIWRSGTLPQLGRGALRSNRVVHRRGGADRSGPNLGKHAGDGSRRMDRLERDRPTFKPARSRSPAAGALTSAWLAYFREPDKAEVPRTLVERKFAQATIIES